MAANNGVCFTNFVIRGLAAFLALSSCGPVDHADIAISNTVLNDEASTITPSPFVEELGSFDGGGKLMVLSTHCKVQSKAPA